MAHVATIENAQVIRANRYILGPINFSISEGERWVILGPNGAGKSTLLKLLSTEIFPSSGEVTLLGQKLGKMLLLGFF